MSVHEERVFFISAFLIRNNLHLQFNIIFAIALCNTYSRRQVKRLSCCHTTERLVLCYVLSKLKPPFTLYHYDLIILPTNVRRCYGCNCEFVDKYRQEPYNIIVKHVDRRIVQKDPVTHSYVYSPDFSNTYYHPISYHIRRRKPKNPLFSGSVRATSFPGS